MRRLVEMASGKAEFLARIGWAQTAELLALLVNINRDHQKYPEPIEGNALNPFGQSQTQLSLEAQTAQDEIDRLKSEYEWQQKTSNMPVVSKGMPHIVKPERKNADETDVF